MIRVAVIGAGHWGPNLIRNFQNPPASRLAWVVDRDEGRLDQVRQRFPGVALSTNADDVFADDAVDAVVIATPTSTHYPLVKAALEHDKHVMVEKPITTDGAQARELAGLALERKLVLLVGHVFLYNPVIVRAKEYLDQGLVGSVHYISMVRTNLGPIRVDVNAGWDLASHDISIANYWLGCQPLTASAVGGSWINEGIEDAMFATLRYPGDILVNLHSSWLNPRKSRDITIVGDRSMLTVDDMDLTEPLRIYDKGVADETFTPGFIDSFGSFRASVREGSVTIPRVPMGEPLRRECDHFLTCIETSQEPPTNGLAAAAVVYALEAIDRSAQAGGSQQPVEQVLADQ